MQEIVKELEINMLMKENLSLKVFENHGQDCRYKPLEKVSETVSATYGMGGNNQPLVVRGGGGMKWIVLIQ